MGVNCAITDCQSNRREYNSDNSYTVHEKNTVFKFPKNNPELYQKWIQFAGLDPTACTKYKGLCILHFDKKFIKVGKRTSLIWKLNPVPSDINDLVKDFNDLNPSLCPSDYKYTFEKDLVTFYRIGINDVHNIPEVHECITIDKELHVRLYWKSSPIPLPEWFRGNGVCRVTHKSMIENFPPYIRNYEQNKNTDISVLSELQELQFRRPRKGPRYSNNLLRLALLLRYSSAQTYRLLLEHFPLPSISYLRKLCKGGVEPLKGAKLLLEKGEVDTEVILMMDEIYIQKEEQFNGGELIGCDEHGQMYKGVMSFMMVGIRKAIPWVVKAVPEIKIEGSWLASHIDDIIADVHEAGFRVRGIVADDHSTNVSAYHVLIKKYGGNIPNSIIHPSNKNLTIYLFFDSVHLLKNIRNNLFNNKRFLFPEFSFNGFYDNINFPGGEISWKLLHDVHEKDLEISGNLKKACKLSYKVLHPGDNKQSVTLALAIFDPTTYSAIRSYFSDKTDAAGFLQLINTWWTVSNAKGLLKANNIIGSAAVKNDKKPLFLRSFAEKWQDLQHSNSSKYTLSKQTFTALITTLKCTALLIEDLLRDGFSFVLTSRFQSDPLENRFSKYRQMSGGRFLVALREVETSERVLSITSLLKENINIWSENVKPDDNIHSEVVLFEENLQALQSSIDECMLGSDGIEVAAVIAGYIAKKLMEKRCCNECSKLLIAQDKVAKEYDYLLKLSRGGLIVPSIDLCHYVSKSFAILDSTSREIRKSTLPARSAAKLALKYNTYPKTFICSDHQTYSEFINLTISNIFFNNERKNTCGKVRKETVRAFKQRQVKKQKLGD